MPSPRIASACAFLAVLLCTSNTFAQGVGINGTGAAADTSAILDLSATNKGLLVPRMTAAQRTAIVLPATGLVVFQTDGTAGLYYNAGTSASPSWQLVGANAIGGQWSTSGANLYYSAGKVAVGTTPGAYRFTVLDTGSVLRVQANNANGVMASFGGAGQIQVDAPGVFGGRLMLLDNGYLGLGRTTPTARLDVLGGNFDLASTEGDARIGDGNYRMKFGVATGGNGAGAATIMQHGLAGGYNVLALGAQGNKVAYVNGNTQRLGIGTDSPTAPLGFAAATGKKITLYPGNTGDYGLGISAGRLFISTETAGTDIALGYDNAGTFNERFAFKTNGAMAVNGSTGAAGQVLQSNGAGASPTWVSPTAGTYGNLSETIGGTSLTVSLPFSGPALIPGMSKTVTVSSATKALVSWSIVMFSNSCFACGNCHISYDVMLDGVVVREYIKVIPNGEYESATGTCLVSVPAGTHTLEIKAQSVFGTGATFGTTYGPLMSEMVVQVIPQ